VLRIPVPGEDQASAGTDTGSTEAATTPAPGAEAVGPAGSTVPAEPTFGGVGNLRVWALIIGGGIVLMVLTAGGLMFGTRRR